MKKKNLKMWIVKKEVYAASLKDALSKSGRIYSVEEAAPNYQPDEKKEEIGYKNK